MQNRFERLAKAAGALEKLASSFERDVEAFSNITKQYATQIESDSNLNHVKLYTTAWLERFICFRRERLALITGVIDKTFARPHLEHKHSRPDSSHLYKMDRNNFFSACSVDGVDVEYRSLVSDASRLKQSRSAEKLLSSLDQISFRVEQCSSTLELRCKPLLTQCASVIEASMKNIHCSNVSISTVENAESVSFDLPKSFSGFSGENTVCRRRGDSTVRMISQVEARSVTIEDFSDVKLSKQTDIPTVRRNIRKVVDLAEEQEDRERLEALKKRRATDCLDGFSTEATNIRTIMAEFNRNADELQSAREKAEREEDLSDPDELYTLPMENEVTGRDGIGDTVDRDGSVTNNYNNDADFPVKTIGAVLNRRAVAILCQVKCYTLTCRQAGLGVIGSSSLQLFPSSPTPSDDSHSSDDFVWSSVFLPLIRIIAAYVDTEPTLTSSVWSTAELMNASIQRSVVRREYDLEVSVSPKEVDLSSFSQSDQVSVRIDCGVLLDHLVDQSSRRSCEQDRSVCLCGPTAMNSCEVNYRDQCFVRGSWFRIPRSNSPCCLNVQCSEDPLYVVIATILVDIIAGDEQHLSLLGHDYFLVSLLLSLEHFLRCFRDASSVCDGNSSIASPTFLFVNSSRGCTTNFHGRAHVLNVFLSLIRILVLGPVSDLSANEKVKGFTSFRKIKLVDTVDQVGIDNVWFGDDSIQVLKFHCEICSQDQR